MFKFWIALCGFFTFGIIGGAIGAILTKSAGAAIFFGIIFAILGAIVAFKLYLVGVFILCGFMGFLIGLLLTHNIPLGAVLGIVIGVLGVIFVKPVIIISTSFSGGMVAASNLCVIFGMWNPSVELILGIILFIAGMVVQFSTDKNKPKLPYPVQPVYSAPVYTNPQNSFTYNPNPEPQQASANVLSENIYSSTETAANIENTMAFCTQCGSPIKKTDKFCINCGAQSRSASI